MDKVEFKTFCTTREAARMLGVSVKTAQIWLETGLLDGWRTGGGHRRILRSSVSRLLSNPMRSPAVTGIGITHPPCASALKMLVVEDDYVLRRMYEARMSVWRCRPFVQYATNGIDALLRVGMDCPDLLVTDLHMPDMDGFMIVRVLRRLPEFACMRMVVVTGLDQSLIDEAGGLPEGITVFTKPVPFSELEALAEELSDHLIEQRNK